MGGPAPAAGPAAAPEAAAQDGLTLQEECDAAEVTWGALEDRRDMLRLLAGIALGRRGADYEPPSVTLTEWLADPPEPEPPARGLARQAEVMAFIAQTGGE